MGARTPASATQNGRTATVTRSGRGAGRIRARLASQAGNAMMLMPAAAIIVLGLGALAADSAIQWRAQFELDAVASSLANDAASAVSTADWFDGGDATADPDLVRQVIASYTSRSASVPLDATCELAGITAGSPAQITITCSGTGDYVFRRGQFDANATATAILSDGT